MRSARRRDGGGTIAALRIPLARAVGFVLAATAPPVLAVESCDLDGQPVNPANGYTTQGKSGLMRCRDGEGGPVVREQELKNGVFMGVVRHFKDGSLEREYRVDERGNRDGPAREWERATNAGKPVLVHEETYRNGSAVGLARSWYSSGQLRRVSFHDDASHELASAEFTPQGQLADLRCAARAVLGSDADDARWCGHVGPASNVVLFSAKGVAKARVSYDHGERRRSEYLADNGNVLEVQEASSSGGVERTFYADGTKRREVRWVATAGERGRHITTLDQEFHESGKLVREQRWRVGERGGERVSEQLWYLNGQPKEKTEFVSVDGRALRQETTFHDNGRKAFEGAWRIAASQGRGSELATGVHKRWDGDGTLRAERYYDERGRITRERTFDGGGAVVRDDEVFEDGSRKAFGR